MPTTGTRQCRRPVSYTHLDVYKRQIQEIATEAKAHGFKKALVCSDPDVIKFGVTAKVTDIRDKNGLEYELYSEIKPNPTIDNVKPVSYTHLDVYKRQGIISRKGVVLSRYAREYIEALKAHCM